MTVGTINILALAILAVIFAPAPELSAAETLSGSAFVLDGDTIELQGRRIRLQGIDAPENNQTCTIGNRAWSCGLDAKTALAARIGGNTVLCQAQDTPDRYGRLLAVCHTQGIDLNAWMVRLGWAIAYRRYSLAYVSEEETARKEGRGLWASDFTAPWQWRIANRSGR